MKGEGHDIVETIYCKKEKQLIDHNQGGINEEESASWHGYIVKFFLSIGRSSRK